MLLILEVKSEREVWTAGDVLRQLKRYRGDTALFGDCWERSHVLALFSGRPVAAVERKLLEHESVVIVSL